MSASLNHLVGVLLATVSVPCTSAGQGVRFMEQGTAGSRVVFDARFTDAVTSGGNPSVIPHASGWHMGASASNRFSIAGLADAAVHIVRSDQASCFTSSIYYSGTTLFNRSGILLGYGKSLGRVNAGLQFHLERQAIVTGKPRLSGGWTVSATCRLHEEVHFSIMAANLPVFTGSERQKMPAMYLWGLGFSPGQQVYTGLAVVKTDASPVRFNVLLHYHISEAYTCRLGFLTGSAEPHAGFWWFKKDFRIGISLHWHASLGVTPTTLLLWGRNSAGLPP